MERGWYVSPLSVSPGTRIRPNSGPSFASIGGIRSHVVSEDTLPIEIMARLKNERSPLALWPLAFFTIDIIIITGVRAIAIAVDNTIKIADSLRWASSCLILNLPYLYNCNILSLTPLSFCAGFKSRSKLLVTFQSTQQLKHFTCHNENDFYKVRKGLCVLFYS